MGDIVKSLEVIDAILAEDDSPPKGAVAKVAPPVMGPTPADLGELKVLSAQASCRELIFELGMQVSIDANNARYAGVVTNPAVVKWLDKARAVDLSLEEMLKVIS